MNWAQLPTTLATSIAYLLLSHSWVEAKPETILTHWASGATPEQTVAQGGGKTGNRSSGGRRTGCTMAKTTTNQDLYALVPGSGATYSLEATPTLWFYVPYDTSTTTATARLTVQSQDNSAPSDSKLISLSKTPGIIGVRLPQPLKPGVSYHWFFTILCDAKTDGASVDGWIQRLELSPNITTQMNNEAIPLQQRLELYQQNRIWSDRLTLLATQVNKNSEARLAWDALLREGGLERLRQEPVQGFYTLK